MILLIITLDIETSSLARTGNSPWMYFNKSIHSDPSETEYGAIMYAWGSYEGDVYHQGRGMDSLGEYLNKLKEEHDTPVVWIHNLAFEFQFLRNVLDDMEVFARKNRKPLKAKSGNMTFKCTYMLTGDSLAVASSKYCPMLSKLVGDLDYTKPRHERTPLTAKELEYLRVDNEIVKHIVEAHERDYEELEKIPMTATGKLRKELKENRYSWATKKKIASICPIDIDMFKRLAKAFAGGYTHANEINSNQIKENVQSWDIVSSYPTDMLLEKYPMGKWKEVQIAPDQIGKKSDKCHLLQIGITGLKSKGSNHYISVSQCESYDVKSAIIDNGRLDKCDSLTMYCTNVDFTIIKQNYNYEDIQIIEAFESKSGYLPTELTEYIVELFMKKQTLKGVDDDEYAKAKARLNSLYGMLVTNTIRDEVVFEDNEWKEMKPLTEMEAIELLQTNSLPRKVVGNYAWGVWVTAYARRKLWYLIRLIGNDVVYCDTDSIKFMGDHTDTIEEYNEKIADKRWAMATRLDVDYEILGNIGEFEQEATSDRFITLGAKKYCQQMGDKLKITVSGVPKSGVSQLESIEDFKAGFVWEAGTTSKTSAYYQDHQQAITLTDYTGITHTVSQQFSVAIIPTSYKLGLSVEYEEYLLRERNTTTTRWSILGGLYDDF